MVEISNNVIKWMIVIMLAFIAIGFVITSMNMSNNHETVIVTQVFTDDHHTEVYNPAYYKYIYCRYSLSPMT